jgi:hypothetical protein
MDISPLAPETILTDAECRKTEAEFILAYLRTHDALCPLCHYNLRNLTVPRCPECGREIRIQVGLKEPYLRAMVTLLVAMCLSAGGGLLSLLVVVGFLVHEGRLPPIYARDWPLAFLIYGSMFSLVPAACSILLYRRILRLDKIAQYILAGVAIFWDALLVLMILALMLGLFRL